MITAEEVEKVLDIFPVSSEIVDANYSLPSRKWLFGEFAGAMRGNRFALGLSQYSHERNDCDDYALLTAALARGMHGRQFNGPKTSLAFGIVFYQKDNSGGHAINFAIVEEDGKRLVVFMEPQSGAELKLTQTEINSVTFMYI